MKTRASANGHSLTATAFLIVTAVIGHAADFDGDGVSDSFTLTREAAKVAKDSTVRREDPWEARRSKQLPKGVALVVRLSRGSQTYLLHDLEFFKTPIWMDRKPPVRVITKQDRRFPAWKKQVPALKADAIELGTEAGIDILLYWDGKRWRVFWPDEEP
jgi:hypothetical protein